MYQKVQNLFQQLQEQTDVIMSKRNLSTDISEFDITSLALILADIEMSPEFEHMRRHTPSAISSKSQLLTHSREMLREFRKNGGQTQNKISSSLFQQYDTRKNQHQRALSLEKMYPNNQQNSNSKSLLLTAKSYSLEMILLFMMTLLGSIAYWLKPISEHPRNRPI